MFLKDLIAFKLRSSHVVPVDVHVDKKVKPVTSYMTVQYHDLPNILHNKSVWDSTPHILRK